jgi:hypothetical protein
VPNSIGARPAVPVAEVVESRVLFSAAPHLHPLRRPHVGAALPAAQLSASVPGLTGTYYQGPNFRQQVLVRTDSNVDFQWGQGAPDPSLLHRAFSVRWTGQITAPTSEIYTFSTVADDGVRLWVGGKLIIADWHDQFATAARGSIQLQTGQTYDIRLDYFENGHPPAVVRLYWATPTIERQIIPASALDTAPNAPRDGAVPNTPASPPPLAAPASLSALATGPNQIHLNWSDVSGETGFVVQRSADGTSGWTGIATIAAGQTQFDDKGLAPSTIYFYRVVATNALTSSGTSNVATATTDGLVYGLTNNAEVQAIDLENATTTQVGTLAFGTAAADRNPTDGKFYYIEQNTSTPRVAIWDPATNTNITLATLSLTGPVMRAAFDAQGVLYIIAGNSDLYMIDTTTGAATFIGTVTADGAALASPSGDMAFAPDGTLYIDDNGALYAANVATLTASYIGSDGAVGNVQVAFGSDGLFYGTVSTGDLYRIDLATGATTLIGDTGVYQIGDLAPTWG